MKYYGDENQQQLVKYQKQAKITHVRKPKAHTKNHYQIKKLAY